MSKGILYTETMFNAVVEGRKTQTRRLLKPQPQGCFVPTKDGYQDGHFRNLKPRYKVGEKVYIKEPIKLDIDNKTLHLKYSDVTVSIELPTNFLLIEKFMKLQNRSKDGYYPKMYIPTWIPKDIFKQIEITAVRCERLQDISDEDCLKEGIVPHVRKDAFYSYDYKRVFYSAKESYADLINKINGKGTWENNPYVFVYDFKLLK